MCGEVVAAPLSLQDTVYPISRKKSLPFCEKSKKFLKLCTAGRKKCKMKRLRRKKHVLMGSVLALSGAFAPALPKGEVDANAVSRRRGRGRLRRTHPFSLATLASSPKGAPELPQSKPAGFAGSLWEGASGAAVRSAVKPLQKYRCAGQDGSSCFRHCR